MNRILSAAEIDAVEARLRAGKTTERDIERLIFTARKLMSAEGEKSKSNEAKPKRAPGLKKPISAPQCEIFTDGACSGNPGPGGWGAIIRMGGRSRELSGGDRNTTNNRMELTGAIEALKALPEHSRVVLTTDSEYVKKGITVWIHSWKKNGWKNASKQPVKNADLWKELDELNQAHTIEWRWVRGHNGHPENERCDELARKCIGNVW